MGFWDKILEAIKSLFSQNQSEEPKSDMPIEQEEEMNNNNKFAKRLEGVIPDNVLREIPDIEGAFDINYPLRLSHFLSQTAHESGNFQFLRENLNYSAAALRAVFGRHFPTDEIANEYARQPERIANRAYANRMGNGSEESGDGWRFRGRGYIQLTGRNNYTAFSKSIGVDVVSNPDLVATRYPLLSAGWFWFTNGLNELADSGADEATIRLVTRRVNGGLNGLDDRINKFYQFYDLLKK